MAKKKRRRKPKKQQPKPISTALKAEKTRQYFDRLLEICDAFGAKQEMEKIPLSQVAFLYLARFRFKVLGGPEAKLFPGIVGLLRKVVDQYLDNETFKFQHSETEIPYREYFTHVLTLYHWYRTLEDVPPQLKKQLDEKLKPLVQLCSSETNPERKLETYMDILASSITTTPEQVLVAMEKDEHSESSIEKQYFGIHVTVRFYLTDTKCIRFEQRDTTEVFHVCWWRRGYVHHVHLNSEDLSDNTLMRGLKLDVYMQKHAFNRLYERLDLFTRTELYYNLGNSVEEGNILPMGNNRGLLGYYFYGHLLGYLLVEVIEGIAVVRTFLFLTNDDTPQGKKLFQLLKLNKLDKSYTGLDRLETYVFGDLKKDKKLYKILKEADCSILLNLHQLLIERATQKHTGLDAESIKKYLELEDGSQA